MHGRRLVLRREDRSQFALQAANADHGREVLRDARQIPAFILRGFWVVGYVGEIRRQLAALREIGTAVLPEELGRPAAAVDASPEEGNDDAFC